MKKLLRNNQTQSVKTNRLKFHSKVHSSVNSFANDQIGAAIMRWCFHFSKVIAMQICRHFQCFTLHGLHSTTSAAHERSILVVCERMKLSIACESFSHRLENQRNVHLICDSDWRRRANTYVDRCDCSFRFTQFYGNDKINFCSNFGIIFSLHFAFTSFRFD